MPENTEHYKNNPSAPSPTKKKTPLGRGLGSLLGDQGALAADHNTQTLASQDVRVEAPTQNNLHIDDEAKIWMIPVDRLAPNIQQPRQEFSASALEELSSSIREKGILQPIVARRISERQFEIIAGERRWRAAQLAGLHEVPVILKKVDERSSLEYAIIENIQRENLNPVEEAEAFQLLIDKYSLTQQQIAEKLGKERSTVTNTLRLLTLPAEIRTLIRNNSLSAGHAKVILGLDDPDRQLDLAKRAIAEKLSVRATEKLVAKFKSNRPPLQTVDSTFDVDVPKRLIDGLSSELQKLVGTKVSIDYSGGKGKVQIHFYSDDQLSQFVEKIRHAWEK